MFDVADGSLASISNDDGTLTPTTTTNDHHLALGFLISFPLPFLDHLH